MSYFNVSFNERGASTKPHYKDIIDVTADYAADKPFALAKAVYVAIDCLKEADWIPEGQSESYNTVRFEANRVKLVGGFGKWLDGFNKLRNKTVEVLTDEQPISEFFSSNIFSSKLFSWTRTLNDMVNPTNDIAEFFTKAVLYIPKTSIAALKGINGASMVFGFGCLTVESLGLLADNKVHETSGEEQEEEVKKGFNAMLKLAYEVSLLTLGVLTVLSTYFGVIVAPVAFLVCSAGSVAFSILKYYQENLGEPVKN